jgi:hypothetical protein
MRRLAAVARKLARLRANSHPRLRKLQSQIGFDVSPVVLAQADVVIGQVKVFPLVTVV